MRPSSYCPTIVLLATILVASLGSAGTTPPLGQDLTYRGELLFDAPSSMQLATSAP